jgi:hypothetical protein
MARGRRSVWLALLYGLAPGLVLSVQRDLAEPLAYGLAVLGVLALGLGGDGTRSVLVAGLLFGLAALARQPTLLFPIAYGAGLLLTRRRFNEACRRPSTPSLCAFFLLAFGPYIAWTLALHNWLGAFPGGPRWIATPLGWLTEPEWSWSRQPAEILGVVLPTLLWLAVVVDAIRRRALAPPLACAGVAAIAFVIFGPDYGRYPGAGRAVLTVAVPALLATPFLSQLSAWARRAHWLAVVCWLSVLPAVAYVDLLDVT